MTWSDFGAAWPIEPERRPDPYARWAAATAGAYLADTTVEICRLALHLREPYRITEHLLKVPGVRVPGVYNDSTQFATAEIEGADQSAWEQLRAIADVAMAEPGMARPDEAKTPRTPMLQRSEYPAPRASEPGRVVIGVVDGACGFANRQFRSRGKDGRWQTRLAAFWDQQGRTDGQDDRPWSCPPDLGYGRELQRGDLDSLLEEHLGAAVDDNDEAQAAGERAIYRALRVDLPAAADWTHGTHVLDTAAGAPQRTFLPAEVAGDATLPNPDADVAKADLVIVQLPEAALRDTSGRWAAALVLDGLRYIVARADEKADIVVNLSLGSFAGPHDGSSMLELAIDDLIEEVGDRLTVVVAAGNARNPHNDGDGTPRRCAAQGVLAPKGQANDQRTLVLDVEEADATETFVEIWLSGARHGANGPLPVTVELDPPGAAKTLAAAPGKVATLTHGGQDATVAQVINLSNGIGRGARGQGPMVLVAIGTTRDVGGYRAPLGQWRITVSSGNDAPVTLQAWVERRDIPGELDGERPQYGFDGVDDLERAACNTMGSLAGGKRTIVVAAAEFPNEGGPLIADFSSTAPKQAGDAAVRTGPGPVVSAPCELMAAGFLTGSYKTLKGTSMSSALVTRVVASRIALEGRPAGGVRDWLEGLAKTSIATKSQGPGDPSASQFIVVPSLKAE